MSELTISGFEPQVSWPFGGETATLRYQYSADFVDSDGQTVLRGLYKEIACTIVAGVLTVPSHTVITTNDAIVNPLATLSARVFDAQNTPRLWLFQGFSIPESLTPTTTIGDLTVYNQGNSLVLPPDAYLTRDLVIALIAERLPNVILASDVLNGLTRLSVAPASALLPVAVGDNDPRVPTSLTAAGQALLDDANAAAQLITLGLTATAAEINKLDGAGTIVASGTQHANVANAAETAVAAGAISASSNDADGAKLSDVQALRTQVNALVTDVGNLVTKMNAIFDALEAFQINAA